MPTVLEARNVSFSYDAGFRVEGLSFHLEAGETVALVGPNGAGKSTLLKLLAGILAPSSGTVTSGGRDLIGLPAHRRARAVAWVPQEMDVLFPVTVEEAIRMGFFPRSARSGWSPPAGAEKTLDVLLDLLDLAALRRRDVRCLSGGERRRVLLARGLAQGAQVLLLDEPTSHLDPRHQAELARLIRRLAAEGVAVVAALHDLNLAMSAFPRVVLLKAGLLLADGPVEGAGSVLTPAFLERTYDLPAEVLRPAGGGPPFIRFSIPSEEMHP